MGGGCLTASLCLSSRNIYSSARPFGFTLDLKSITGGQAFSKCMFDHCAWSCFVFELEYFTGELFDEDNNECEDSEDGEDRNG